MDHVRGKRWNWWLLVSRNAKCAMLKLENEISHFFFFIRLSFQNRLFERFLVLCFEVARTNDFEWEVLHVSDVVHVKPLRASHGPRPGQTLKLMTSSFQKCKMRHVEAGEWNFTLGFFIRLSFQHCFFERFLVLVFEVARGGKKKKTTSNEKSSVSAFAPDVAHVKPLRV